MKQVIELLEKEISNLEYCLNNKDWASDKTDDYHINVRKRYKKRLEEFQKALKLIKKG